MTIIFICVEGNKTFSALNTTFYTRAKSLSNQEFDKNVSLNDLENRSDTSTVWVSNPFALPLSEAEPEGGPEGGPEAESEIPSDEPGSEPDPRTGPSPALSGQKRTKNGGWLGRCTSTHRRPRRSMCH